MGETCGLKLVFDTNTERDVCKLCHDIEKKQRRYDKMSRDVERWQREGNRTATIERTCGEMGEVTAQISRMKEDHDRRLQSLSQVRQQAQKTIPYWHSKNPANMPGQVVMVARIGIQGLGIGCGKAPMS